MIKPIYIKTRSKWRDWLKRNHKKKKEVWLLYYKKHTGKTRTAYSDALKEALCFGWIDGKVMSIDGDTYMQRWTPRRPKSQWSTINVGLYNELVKTRKMTASGREAFERKSRVYESVRGTDAYAWHIKNKMPRHATLKDRIAYHKSHQEKCGCRPVPQSLSAFFSE